ncbi:MAG: AAA family ATPase [Patescibacteria group bacterium]|nr:AAA family ATPase [Patescibacteria group bacterium]
MGSPDKKGVLDESVFTEVVNTRILGSRTAAMRTFFSERVIGQPHAIDAVVRRFTVHYAGLSHLTRPIGTFVFSGPTGVGKTLTAEVLARYLIADVPEPPMTEIQSERYADDHQVLDLIGAPPSYVGYDQPGILAQLRIDGPHFWVKITPHLQQDYVGPMTEKDVRAFMLHFYEQFAPYYSVILFDEIEKAHPRLRDFILSILDKGRLTMSDGEVVLYKNSTIILTCNIAGREQKNIKSGRRGLGFAGTRADDDLSDNELIRKRTLEKIEEFWPPEFVGRLRKNIIVFNQLDHDSCTQILDKALAELQDQLTGERAESVPMTIDYSDRLKDWLLDQADYIGYGARQINDVVETHVREPLSNAIESEQLEEGDKVLFTLDETGQIEVRRKPRPPKPSGGKDDALMSVENGDEKSIVPVPDGAEKK